ncbi:MAG: GDSL-type esterase/lipase family protein [Planctomycetota bacterium]|nr:GDSL-type esterase/lipase family protein [Planctomycetota bacterium]
MHKFRFATFTLMAVWLISLAPGQGTSQAPRTAEGLLKPKPRPKKAALPPSTLPLLLQNGERIALVGNSTGERFNLFGAFETLLQQRFTDKKLVFRNFSRPADEVGNRQRPSDYTKLDDPLFSFNPDTLLCFFGYNESFQGAAGLPEYERTYEAFLDEYAQKYARDDAGSPPRFVLVSPIAFEKSGDPLLPSASERNAALALYTTATQRVAAKRNLAFVDLFTPTQKPFAGNQGARLTINGCHLNEAGDRVVGALLDNALFGGANPGPANGASYEKLRAAVNDKSWVHQQDYRMLNGWYVYGGRRTWDTETFPREYAKIRAMAAVRDQYVWDIAAGKTVPAQPDDSKTGDLYTPNTRFGVPGQKYSENQEGGPKILPPDELIKSCTVPPGFEIKLFADESKFPEIAKPVQMSFDAKGRLWVSTMPSYPLWKPGDPKPSDKLVILEDTNNDGKADKSTVFYDKLQCPTGFEFFNGGVLVVDQPRILWLKDTDGDDKADQVTHVLDGWATEDTHHTVGAFEFSNSGLLHMLEGVAMSTAIETPWGAFRNFGTPGSYVVDPRTWKVRHFVTPGYGNPWCYVFDQWGQGFCGDGTMASQHWDTPLSGAQYRGRKGLNTVFNTEGMRPVVGSEFLNTRQFPDNIQGQFLYACVINMNGIPRWTFSDDGAGFKGTRVRHNPADPKNPFDLIKSTDKHFRPVDPQIGPDGALWFGDWANPLIGHMQYSQRDPNRDHVHGRIYRLVYKDKPLLKPVTQQGKPVAELLEQFREPEWRTRYRVRRELQARPAAEVLRALDTWVGALDATDPVSERLRTEALWVRQGLHQNDQGLLRQVLASKSPEARAAAVRVIADERDRLANAQELLLTAAKSTQPRVVTEAIRGLSFFSTTQAMDAVLNAMTTWPSDYWVRYTADAALGANLETWRAGYIKGELAKGNPEQARILDGLLAADKRVAGMIPHLQVLLGKDQQPEEAKSKAMQAIVDTKGGEISKGRAVFLRNCTACHKATNEGSEFGPILDKVASRLTPYKLVESMINPNAEVDKKYYATVLSTSDGKTINGLLLSETKDEVVIFDGKQKRTIKTADIEEKQMLKQSSMPEGLAGAMSPGEFLDLMAFLGSLK